MKFLDCLFGEKKPTDYVLLWEKSIKKSHWFTDLEEAEEFAHGKPDIYVGCCLSGSDRGPTKRCPESSVVLIPGLWCDVDFGGNASHKAKNLPPNEDAAMELINSLGVAPTMVVHSGFGLQAWWLLAEPLRLESDKERADAKAFSQRLQDTLIDAGKKRGWKVDSVGDLARILRLPGTCNGKVDPPVEVRIFSEGGPRYHSLNSIYRMQEKHITEEEAFPETARDPDHFERIAKGVSEGSRNVDAASYIGKLLSDLKDTSDGEAVSRLWELVKAWNRSNSPPILDKELETTFKSIVRRDRSRKLNTEYEGETAKYVDSFESDSVVPQWKMVIVDSLPRIYRIWSPLWSMKSKEGYVEVTAATYISSKAMRLSVLNQTDVFLSESSFRALWNGTKTTESVARSLLQTATYEQSSPESSDDSRMAMVILDAIESHSVTCDAPTDECKVRIQVGPDGCHYFTFRCLMNHMGHICNEKLNSREISHLVDKLKIGHKNLKPGGKAMRIRTASVECLDGIRAMTIGRDID